MAGDLAWRNVVGQSTNAGTSALQSAGNLFSSAMNKLSATAQDKQTALVKQNTDSALDSLQAARTSEDITAVSKSLRAGALNTQFGEGNVDISLLTRAVEAKRKGVIRETQNTEDRTNRLRLDAKLEKQADYRFQQTKDKATLIENARQDRSTAYGILADIPTNAQIATQNTEAFVKARDKFYDTDADSREGDHINIGEGGSVTFTPEFSKEKQDAFNEFAYEFGARSFTSFKEKRDTLINSLRSSNLESLIPEFSTLFEQQQNASKLSREDQGKLASKVSGFAAKQAREIEKIDKAFDLKASSIKQGTTLSTDESTEANIKLYALMAKEFDDEIIGPFYTGFQDPRRLGGAELKDVVDELLMTGIPTTDPSVKIAVSPDTLIKHLVRLKRNAGIIDGVGDSYVDKPTFINAVTNDVLSDATKTKTTTLRLELEANRNAEIAAVEREMADALASYTTNFYASGGIINPNRNVSKLRN